MHFGEDKNNWHPPKREILVQDMLWVGWWWHVCTTVILYCWQTATKLQGAVDDLYNSLSEKLTKIECWEK